MIDMRTKSQIVFTINPKSPIQIQTFLPRKNKRALNWEDRWNSHWKPSVETSFSVRDPGSAVNLSKKPKFFLFQDSSEFWRQFYVFYVYEIPYKLKIAPYQPLKCLQGLDHNDLAPIWPIKSFPTDFFLLLRLQKTPKPWVRKLNAI